MNKASLPYQLAHRIGVSLTIGSLTWVVLLVSGAFAFRQQTGNGYDVAAGPFVLTRLHRQTTPEGINIGFTFENGLPWFVLCWIIAGVLWGLITFYARRSRG